MAQSLKIEKMYNCIKEDQTVIGGKKGLKADVYCTKLLLGKNSLGEKKGGKVKAKY